MPDESDNVRLHRIAAAIERIGRYTAGLTAGEFQEDTMVRDAVLRNFDVISHEARDVGPAFRTSRPGLPWTEIEQLAGRVLAGTQPREGAIIWEVIQNELPALVDPLAEALSREGKCG